MNKKVLIPLIAFVAGVLGGQTSSHWVTVAHAAQAPMILEHSSEVLARCDFTKTIVLLPTGVACLPR